MRPNLEFCSSAWDPHQENQKKKIEMVQRRAARYIKRNYSRQPGTVTALLMELNIPSLESRRHIQRLTVIHKAIHGKIAVNVPHYFTPTKYIYEKFPS